MNHLLMNSKYTTAACPGIKGGRRGRINRQGSNRDIGQAVVEKGPVSAAVCAFDHAIICPDIEDGRRRRVNRQSVNNPTTSQAGPVPAAVGALPNAAG